MAKRLRKVLKKRKVESGIVHIQTTCNNTIVSISNFECQVISWASAGVCGLKVARKSTPFAAKAAATSAAQKSMLFGMKNARVLVKGAGRGRKNALRGLQEAGLRLSVIRDVTPIPHNGCRPPSKRRL